MSGDGGDEPAQGQVQRHRRASELAEGEAELRRRATELADGIEAALPTWVVRSVTGLAAAWAGRVDATVLVAAEEAGWRAGEETGRAVRELLEADVDDQATTPLALLRAAVRYPTEVLAAAGVPEVERDDFTRAAFPQDVYDLSPGSFADIDPALAEPGLAWGAAKAWVHLRRHRPA